MQTASNPSALAPNPQTAQNGPQTPANGHFGNVPKSARTVAQARTERAGRLAAGKRAPVTDKSADALLETCAPDAEYPALTSRTLARREMRDANNRDSCRTGNGDKAHDSTNVNSPNFNRVASPSSLSTAALDNLVAEDVSDLLDALNLDADTRQMLVLRMDGHTLQQIADLYDTHKQTVDRRIQAVGMKLFAHWLADQSCGYESVIRTESHKSIIHSLAGGRPAAPASVCVCGSHQHRAQRVKGQEGAVTFHCEHCKAKRTETEFRALMAG